MTKLLTRTCTIPKTKKLLYYVTKPYYDESSKPSEPVLITTLKSSPPV